ncbi:hypothetical protein [Candidatus Accumulibacter sp. ACC007]|uniref:hypothetical protein n=1 Tax=Candidatus Accumulibacter sp. ACC007 TaxID=2823333 RepID=UPI0025C08FD5|nr:hypothetical protein [Candidatus Accumulibacter sp. ACC007]
MKRLELLVALFSALGLAQHTHMHGEDRLDVAIDMAMAIIVTLNRERPLDAAVGFERTFLRPQIPPSFIHFV